MASSPIPKADQWLDQSIKNHAAGKRGINALLVGLHGTGKTTYVMERAAAKGLKVALFTCSILDPYTDFVGVPFQVITNEGTPSESRYLEKVRPKAVDECDLIFFDEINRAAPVVLNAMLEIIQFGTINGEKLPKLIGCWAAMNPPDAGYDVNPLDPALVDRFDTFYEVKAKPSVKFMSQSMRPEIAKALVKWWEGMDRSKRDNTDYISPRRLEKIGIYYDAFGTFEEALPASMTVERAKLADLFRDAENQGKGVAAAASQGGIGGAANATLTYNRDWIREYPSATVAVLSSAPDDLTTHNAVVACFDKTSGANLVKDDGEVLNAIKPSVLEAFVAGLSKPKAKTLAENVAVLPQADRDRLASLVSVVEADAQKR